jgi:eukaryotic-like serine/threonine-protein kinase
VVFLGRRDGKTQIYIRNLDSMEAKPISGTEGAFCTPFFSPDGQWIGFISDSKLKKVAVNGGAAVVLAEMAGITGASWEIADAIVVGTGPGGLLKVPAAGGKPEPLTTPDAASGETRHGWPQVLPGGEKVLYAATGNNLDDSRIVAQDLRTGERRVLVQGGTFPHYVPTGHVVYVQKGVLMALQFNPEQMTVSGNPVPVGENVRESGLGAAHYGFSRLGSFVYVPGGASDGQQQLVWVDRKGNEELLAAPQNIYVAVRISPDNTRVALDVRGAGTATWIYDLSRHTLTRMFYESGGFAPVWSMDSKRIAFYSISGAIRGISSKPADGSGTQEWLSQGKNRLHPASWSPDGRFLTYAELVPTRGWDIGMLPLDGERKPRTFLGTAFNESTPMISTDGRWLAYSSNESGRFEVYVQPFPEGGEKFQISTGGGTDPMWSHKGRELFYRDANKMMAVPVQTAGHFLAGNPVQLFEARYEGMELAGVPAGSYDISADDQRFLMVKSGAVLPPTQINVVINWFEDLKRKFNGPEFR